MQHNPSYKVADKPDSDNLCKFCGDLPLEESNDQLHIHELPYNHEFVYCDECGDAWPCVEADLDSTRLGYVALPDRVFSEMFKFLSAEGVSYIANHQIAKTARIVKHIDRRSKMLQHPAGEGN